jgi:hypothetical protein
MEQLPLDPVQAAVHARIAELHREAAAARLVSAARAGRRRSWPATLMAALRSSLGGRPTGPTSVRRPRAAVPVGRSERSLPVCCA